MEQSYAQTWAEANNEKFLKRFVLVASGEITYILMMFTIFDRLFKLKCRGLERCLYREVFSPVHTNKIQT